MHRKRELADIIIIVLLLICTLMLFSLINRAYNSSNNLYSYTLTNNLDVILKHSTSKLTTLQLWIRAGTFQENTENNGAAHFLEHLLFKNKKVVAEIEEKGGSINGATSHDFTYYTVTIPESELNYCIKAMGKLIFDADFTATDFDQEKKVIMEEITKDEDNPYRTIYNFIAAKTYKTHPYSRKILGDKKTIQKMTLEDIKKFYDTYYNPNNATLVISGQFSRKDELMKTIRSYEKLPGKSIPAVIVRDTIAPDTNFITERISNLSIPHYVYTFSVPGVNSKDSYGLDVLTYLLANRTNALLSKKLIDDLNIAYSVDASYQTRKERSLFIIDITIKDPSKLNTLRSEVQKVLAADQLSETQISTAKNLLVRDYYLSQEKSENIAYGYGYFNTINSYKYERDYIPKIKTVEKTTIDQIIKTYFTESCQFLFIGKK